MNRDQQKRVEQLEALKSKTKIVKITHPVARLKAKREGLNPDAVTDTERYLLTIQASVSGYDHYPDHVKAAAIEWDAKLERQLAEIKDDPPSEDASPYMMAVFERDQQRKRLKVLT